MTHTVSTLSACTDCLQVTANGSTGMELTPARLAEITTGMDEFFGHLVPGSTDYGFSHTPCDICGTPLAGDRHEVALLSA